MKNTSTILNHAIKKYRKALHHIITISERYNTLNLDKMEQKQKQIFNETMQTFYNNYEYAYIYSEEISFRETLRSSLEAVDDMLFGCRDNNYNILGYDFSLQKAKQNKHLLLMY